MTPAEILNTVLQKNGPDPSDYKLIDVICSDHPDLLKSIDKTSVNFLRTRESFMGHMLHKPHGYDW